MPGTLLELCTIGDFERYPGNGTLDAPGRDWVLMQIRGFSRRAERKTGREFYEEERIRTFDTFDGQTVIQLPAYDCRSGSVEGGKVAEVRESIDQDWTNANTISDPDGWVYDDTTGLLTRKYRTAWSAGAQAVRVKWTSGFGTDVVHVPEDIRSAAVLQVTFWWQRRNELGIASRALQGGSVSVATPAKILPEVEETLAEYATVSL
jgi:hypothetical protein